MKLDFSGRMFCPRGSDEEIEVQRIADCGDPEGGGGGDPSGADSAQAWDQPGHLLRLEVAIRRGQRGGAETAEGAGGRERQAQAHVCRAGTGERSDQGRAEPKTLTPSAKREAVRITIEQ